MQEKLIIYLHAEDFNYPSWAIVAADGSVRQSAYRDNALALAQIAEEKEIIILVAAEEVSLLSVTLPPMNRSRLLQAIPFAVEDQLIAEVDTLHFVPVEQQENGQWTVAVVAHEKMQAWLAQLQAWQIQADRLLPVIVGVPYTETDWHVFLYDMGLLRLHHGLGFACDKENLSFLLSRALENATIKPTVLHLHNYTDQSYAFDLPLAVEEKRFPKEIWIEHISQEVAKTQLNWNLLQGPYTVKKSKLPQVKKMWKGVFYLAGTWVFLLFLYPIISYLILESRLVTLDTQIAAIYKRHFPQARNLVAPKIRMEEKLRKMTMQVGDNTIFLLLGYMGKALSETPNVTMKNFDFQNNQLTTELTASSSDEVTKFTDLLLQQGLRVKQQNVNLTGERINATLIIEV